MTFFREIAAQGRLDRLDSLTKYPSILTYHAMGERGRLVDGPPQVRFPRGVLVEHTEKVDGTNARVIMAPDKSGLIGSREELLYASGDLLHLPTMGIVEGLRNLRVRFPSPPAGLRVYAGEFYGAKVGKAAKQYTATGAAGFRLFDVLHFDNLEMLDHPPEAIAAWRDAGNQPFLSKNRVATIAVEAGISSVPVRLIAESDTLPESISDTYDWLCQFRRTLAGIDCEGGESEGVVIRTIDRKYIAKIRFEDYERSLGIKR